MSRYLKPFACSIRGHCVPDWKGNYSSLEDCENNCQGSESADLIYLILSYDWETANDTTSLDKQELVKREFGLRVSKEMAVTIVHYLSVKDIRSLLIISPTLEDYLFSQIAPFSMMLLEIVMTVGSQPDNWDALETSLRSKVEGIVGTSEPDSVSINISSLLIRVLAKSNGDVDVIVELVRGYLPALMEEFTV